MTNQPKSHGKFREIQYDNRFEIKDPFVINEAEALLTTLAAAEGMPEGQFDVDHLKAMHKQLLGDMYEWAGEFRNTEMMVGNNFRQSTAQPSHVESDTRQLLDHIGKENFANMNRLQFADKMASYYVQLYAISPFPDGNARTARAFIDSLATAHDMQIEWGNVPGDAFNAAVEMSLDGDLKGMRAIMRNVVQPIDLYELHSTEGIRNKTNAIITKAGLKQEMLPSVEMASAADIAKLARFAKNEVIRSLDQFARSGTSFMRDWSTTSIHHTKENTFDRSQGSAVLKEVMRNLSQGPDGPRMRGPG
jgi:cell filamentation protein